MSKQKPNENTNMRERVRFVGSRIEKQECVKFLTKISRVYNEPDLFIHSFRGVS